MGLACCSRKELEEVVEPNSEQAVLVKHSPMDTFPDSYDGSGGGVFSALMINCFDLSGVPDLPLSALGSLGVDAGLPGGTLDTRVDVWRY